MAGSLPHILEDGTGSFTMELLETRDDTREALEECHQIIAVLLELVNSKKDQLDILRLVCGNLGYPLPAVAPIIEPELHGRSSVFKGPITA